MDRVVWMSVVVALSWTMGCDAGEQATNVPPKGNQIFKAAILEITPSGEVVPVSQGGAPGAVSVKALRLVNTGGATLRIDSVELAYEPHDGEANPAFQLGNLRSGCIASKACETVEWKVDDPRQMLVRSATQDPDDLYDDAFDWGEIDIVYTRPTDETPRQATLTIRSNADPGAVTTVALVSQPGLARIQVQPGEVRFQPTKLGATDTQFINVSNVGSETLRIEAIEFYGTSAFRLALAGADYEAGQTIALNPPALVEPGAVRKIEVQWSPASYEAATGVLVLHVNDPMVPAGVEVPLLGSQDVTCVTSSPDLVDFGWRPIGAVAQRPLTLRNCGTADVTVVGVSLDPTGSAAFSLDLSALGPVDEDGALTEPIVLGLNEEVPVVVQYTPVVEATEDADGLPVSEVGYVLVESDSFYGDGPVAELRGGGVDLNCPLPIVEVVGDLVVEPQTVVELRGDASLAPDGPVTQWEWSVDQPPGSYAVFSPAATVPNPTISLDVVGKYRFWLKVRDAVGVVSCWSAFADMEVVPETGMHIELTWDTPGDTVVDEGLEKGADLDLHLLHPAGATFGVDANGDGKPDGWFGLPYDCYYGNPSPNWGATHPLALDDPHLDRDDADGWGPEIMTLSSPQAHAIYRVGVQSFAEHGFGPSKATVRVWLDSKLIWEGSQEVAEGELWESAIVDWKARIVSPIKDFLGYPVILKNATKPE